MRRTRRAAITPRATENVFRQADGQEYLIKRETVLPRSCSLCQGDLVLATASYTHLTYQAVPYYLHRIGLWPGYELRNEQDAVVLTLHCVLSTTLKAETDMRQDAGLALVVLAYHRVYHRFRRRV